MKKKFGFALIGIGLILLLFFVGVDFLGIGRDAGIGASQLLGIQIGFVFFLTGIGLLIVERQEKDAAEKPIHLAKIFDLPLLYWVLFTFLIVYTAFFLLPVFFSKLQMNYLTRYIPDAFVTHIGFDIEAIVSRIENWLRKGQSPYADGFIAYPPLAIALFASLSLIGYPAYYKLMVSITVLAYLISALIIPLLLIQKQNRTLLVLFFITGLFSYGLQFEQERGQFNLIAFTLCLIAIYVFHFHRGYRIFAYLLFSLAIQLKVYPVFFIVMFVSDWRDWRSIIKRFMGLGIFNFFLLFVLGHRLFLDFLFAITNYQQLQSSRYENLSIKGFVYHLTNNILDVTNTNLSLLTGIAEVLFWLVLGSCFLVVIAYSIIHKTRGLNYYLLLVCSIAALIVPSVSNDYKLSILIAPFALLFCCLPNFSHPNKKAFSILLATFASFAYWTTLYPATVKPDFLSRNFPALIAILISITALNFLDPNSLQKNVQEINGSPGVEQ